MTGEKRAVKEQVITVACGAPASIFGDYKDIPVVYKKVLARSGGLPCDGEGKPSIQCIRNNCPFNTVRHEKTVEVLGRERPWRVEPMKPEIAIDVDGVLADVVGSAVKGTDVEETEITQWDPVIRGVHIGERVKDVINLPETILDILPYPGAVEATHRIGEYYSIVIVTARPLHSIKHTYDWLVKHNFNFTRIVPLTNKANFVMYGQEKNQQWLVDDGPHHVVEWVDTGRPAAVPARPWNTSCHLAPGVSVFKDWQGLYRILDI